MKHPREDGHLHASKIVIDVETPDGLIQDNRTKPSKKPSICQPTLLRQAVLPQSPARSRQQHGIGRAWSSRAWPSTFVSTP